MLLACQSRHEGEVCTFEATVNAQKKRAAYCFKAIPSDWDIQGARDRSLTLPIEQAELADSSIPEIVEVTEK